VRQVLSALFVVRRTDKPVQPLLPADQEALVVDLFDLKLEAARIALLRNQTVAFRSALESAQQLLDDNYRVEDAAVIAARDQLEAMKKLELDPPLPDISRSLGLLRAYLDAMPR
jgi:uroporphyrin-3 C-methyltransferase